MTIELWNEGVRLSWWPIFTVLALLVYALFYERQQRRAREAIKDMRHIVKIQRVRSEDEAEVSNEGPA